MLPFKNQVVVSFYVTDNDLDCCVPKPIVPLRTMFLLVTFVKNASVVLQQNLLYFESKQQKLWSHL